MEEITILHAISGIIVGVVGLLQILLKKSGKIHRILGRTYALAWLVLVITGAFIGYLLITLIGVLGMYMVYMGYRFAVKKSVALSTFDHLIIVLANLIALATMIWGIYHFVRGAYGIAVIACFFGVIFFINTYTDYLSFVKGKKVRKRAGHRMQWLFEHYGRMYISYIAAMTAFSALQNVFGIELLNWILPTVIGSLLITLSNRYYFKLYKVD